LTSSSDVGGATVPEDGPGTPVLVGYRGYWRQWREDILIPLKYC
jgi:hypothetical protein